MEYSSVKKRKEIMSFVIAWMNLEITINQKVK